MHWAGDSFEEEKPSHSTNIYKACWELKMAPLSFDNATLITGISVANILNKLLFYRFK